MLDIHLAGGNTPFEAFLLERDAGGDITVTRTALLSNTDINCGDATVNNVDAINFTGTSAIENVSIDLEFGGFAPGQTMEGSPQESEIEIVVDLAGAGESATVRGTSGDDLLFMGSKGVNVNDDGDGNDIRFGASVEVPGMAGLEGADRLRANGGGGTGGPTISPVALIGGMGQDVARGGSGSDYITGMEDDDLLVGGPGNDRMGADVGPAIVFPVAEQGDDILRGGAGGDVLRGGGDDDRVDGGAGDDEEHGGDGADVLLQGKRPNGADHLFGGQGKDAARYDKRKAGVEVTLDNKRNDGASGEKDSVGFKGDVEGVSGGRGPDVVKGNKKPNVLEGNEGADLLVGKGGTDSCLGGPGADVLKSCE